MHNLTVSAVHKLLCWQDRRRYWFTTVEGALQPADWSSQRFQFGNETFLLDKKEMSALIRHHPKMWDGYGKG
ncbi:hypothetical protein SFUMM280S_08954 [Streptomyces fumanus]